MDGDAALLEKSLGGRWYGNLNDCLQGQQRQQGAIARRSSHLQQPVQDIQFPVLLFKNGACRFTHISLDAFHSKWADALNEDDSSSLPPFFGNLLQLIPPRSALNLPKGHGVKLYFDLEQYMTLEESKSFDAPEYINQFVKMVAHCLRRELPRLFIEGQEAEEKDNVPGETHSSYIVGDDACRQVFLSTSSPKRAKQEYKAFKVSFHLVYPRVVFAGKQDLKKFVERVITKGIHECSSWASMFTYNMNALEDRVFHAFQGTGKAPYEGNDNGKVSPCVDLNVYSSKYQALSMPHSSKSPGENGAFRWPCKYTLLSGWQKVKFQNSGERRKFVEAILISYMNCEDVSGSNDVSGIYRAPKLVQVQQRKKIPPSRQPQASNGGPPTVSHAPTYDAPGAHAGASEADIVKAFVSVASLSPARASDRSEWMQVGWALKSIFGGVNSSSTGQIGLSLFQAFSARCPSKFSVGSCQSKYEEGNGTLNIGSLLQWAQADAKRSALDELEGLFLPQAIRPSSDASSGLRDGMGARSVHGVGGGQANGGGVEGSRNSIGGFPRDRSSAISNTSIQVYNGPQAQAQLNKAWADQIIGKCLDSLGILDAVARGNFQPRVIQKIVRDFQSIWTRVASSEDVASDGELQDEDEGDNDSDSDSSSHLPGPVDRPQAWSEVRFKEGFNKMYELIIIYMNRYFCVLTGGEKCQVLEVTTEIWPSKTWRGESAVIQTYSSKSKGECASTHAKSKFFKPVMLELEPANDGSARVKPKKNQPKVRPVCPFNDIFFSSHLGRDRHKVTFEPNPALFEHVERNRVLNLYTELGVPHPRQGATCQWTREELEKLLEPVLDHLRYEICCEPRADEEEKAGAPSTAPKYQYLLKFLAFKYKFPWMRMEVVLVLTGMEGSGKTFLGHFFGELMGSQHYLYRLGKTQLSEEFGVEKEMTNLWTVFDEFSAISERELSKFKGMVTADVRTINRKFLNKVEVPNHTTYMVITNFVEALTNMLTGEARRWFPLSSRNTHAGKGTRESNEYFQKLWSIAPSAFAAYLWYYVDTTDFKPTIFPKTHERQSHLERLVSRGGSLPMMWVIEQLHGGLNRRERGVGNRPSGTLDFVFTGQYMFKDRLWTNFLTWKSEQSEHCQKDQAEDPFGFLAHSQRENGGGRGSRQTRATKSSRGMSTPTTSRRRERPRAPPTKKKTPGSKKKRSSKGKGGSNQFHGAHGFFGASSQQSAGSSETEFLSPGGHGDNIFGTIPSSRGFGPGLSCNWSSSPVHSEDIDCSQTSNISARSGAFSSSCPSPPVVQRSADAYGEVYEDEGAEEDSETAVRLLREQQDFWKVLGRLFGEKQKSGAHRLPSKRPGSGNGVRARMVKLPHIDRARKLFESRAFVGLLDGLENKEEWEWGPLSSRSAPPPPASGGSSDYSCSGMASTPSSSLTTPSTPTDTRRAILSSTASGSSKRGASRSPQKISTTPSKRHSCAASSSHSLYNDRDAGAGAPREYIVIDDADIDFLEAADASFQDKSSRETVKQEHKEDTCGTASPPGQEKNGSGSETY